jgi:hypothetical protein
MTQTLYAYMNIIKKEKKTNDGVRKHKFQKYPVISNKTHILFLRKLTWPTVSLAVYGP